MSEKREKIIIGALKLFNQKGIDSTSTASIAKEAGVGTGTVFHYFSNKEELVNECYVHVKKKLRESLVKVEYKKIEDAAKLYWRNAVEWYLENQTEAQFLSIYQHDPKVNNGKRLEMTIEMSSLIVDYFKKAREEKIVKDLDVNYMCLLASESTILTAQYLRENPDVNKNMFIETSCDMFLKGVLR